MCGIFFYKGNKFNKDDLLSNFNRIMNRGPDTSKLINIDNNIFGFHRLAINDLSYSGMQPFIHDNIHLICNGEIYNFIEIRSELKKEGIKFKTKSDTEVLLRAYIRYGTQCFKRFEGMWSLVLWDNKTGEIILSRDRFGEKPLYTYETSEGLYFGSEIKYLKSLSNSNTFSLASEFATFEYSPTRFSKKFVFP